MPRRPRFIIHHSAFIILLPLLSALGCASPKATFEVSVTNKTSSPISVGLVKVGGQVEGAWAGPEHIAAHAPALGERKWGTLIRPTGTALLGPQTGTFYQGSKAVLRIYAGDHPMDELNAFRRDDPFRADIDLFPGRSAFVVTYTDRGLKVEEVPPDQAPAPTP